MSCLSIFHFHESDVRQFFHAAVINPYCYQVVVTRNHGDVSRYAAVGTGVGDAAVEKVTQKEGNTFLPLYPHHKFQSGCNVRSGALGLESEHFTDDT